jgi:SulP family sulfate permease
MTALLTFGALSVIATPGSGEYVALAAMLALMVGVLRLALGAMRGGFLAFMMSQPALTGFTSAAAILIIASQLPSALGAAAVPDSGLLASAVSALVHPAGWELASILWSLLTIGLVLGGRRLHALFPGVLVAVVGGLVWSRLSGYAGPTVASIPSGLPGLSLGLPWGEVRSLLIPSVVIALVGFAEPAAIARTYAAADRLRWDPNRELLSQGAANLASGLVGGFPVGGSFSRTSLNRMAGGRSRWSGAVTGLVVLAFLPAAGILEPLPKAVLGATVIVAVMSLVRLKPLVDLVRISKPQAVVGWATFSATLILSPRIDQAVILGVGAGIVVHLWRELEVAVTTSLEGDTLTLRPTGVLYFASAAALEDALIGELAANPSARRLHLDLGSLGRIDYTGALALKELMKEAEAAGLEIAVVGAPKQARRLLRKVCGSVPGLD